MAIKTNFLKFHTKSSGELFLFYVFWLGGLFLIWFEAFHILPYYEEKGLTNYPNVHRFFALWFAVNIYGNMFKMVSADLAGRHIISPSGDAPKGWKFCDKCVKNSPERSHHCPICKVCVLKRDHHCWFGACCIGYSNHRHYVVMVIYMVLAAIYANIFNYYFVSEVEGDHGWLLGFVSVLAPHVPWVLGYYDFYGARIVGLNSIGYLLNFLFLWLLVIQTKQMIHGQTKYEAKKGISTYNVGLKKIITEVFGKQWYFVWLSPWIPSPLPGDGVTFEKREAKTL